MRIPEIIVNGLAGTIYLPDGYVLPLTLPETKQWQSVSRFATFTDLVAQPVVLWLLAQKMRNHKDYGWGDWRRVRQQRTSARERLSCAAMVSGSINLAWGCAASLTVNFEQREIGYGHGQEELTNIMRRLVNPSAEYVR